MRLLYVCADRGIPVLGGKGASVHVRSVSAALAGRGHEVVLACAALGAGNPAPPVAAIEVLPGDAEAHLGALVEIVGRHGTEAVIERYSLSCGPARLAATAVGVPHVLEVNAPLVLEAARHRGLGDLDRWLEREREVFAAADAIGVVSSALADYVATVAGGRRARWVPNGVDLGAFADAVPADLGLPSGTLAVGFAGSMKAWHGVDDLVYALAGGAPGHLVLIGTGPEEAAVRARVAAAGMDGRCSLLGQQPHDRVPGLLRALDIGVAPYLPQADFYFSPLKVLEYLAAGLPVVCPDIGDLPALVGSAGVLYPAGDVGALGAAIASLADPGVRARVAAGARRQAARWSWDANAAAYEELVAGALPVPAQGAGRP